MNKKLFYSFAILFVAVLLTAGSCQNKVDESAMDKSNGEENAMMEDGGKDDAMVEDGESMMEDEVKEGAGEMMEDEDAKKDDSAMMEDKSEDGAMMEEGEVKEFTVEGKNFEFSLSSIEVNKGDKVKITFKNTGGTHDWVIDEFNARTKVIKTDESDTVEFTADKVGSFEYYCSIGSHRAMGMKGTLTVN